MSSVEHERKFLVEDQSILRGSVGVEIEQGYVWADKGWAIRARRTHLVDGAAGPEEAPAMVTIKGPRVGNSRPEYEVEVDPEAASQLIAAASVKIYKTRHPIVSGDLTWVVDVFHQENSGLVLAELELEDEAKLARVKMPWWASAEVTNDARYANEALGANPWPLWFIE